MSYWQAPYIAEDTALAWPTYSDNLKHMQQSLQMTISLTVMVTIKKVHLIVTNHKQYDNIKVSVAVDIVCSYAYSSFFCTLHIFRHAQLIACSSQQTNK